MKPKGEGKNMKAIMKEGEYETWEWRQRPSVPALSQSRHLIDATPPFHHKTPTLPTPSCASFKVLCYFIVVILFNGDNILQIHIILFCFLKKNKSFVTNFIRIKNKVSALLIFLMSKIFNVNGQISQINVIYNFYNVIKCSNNLLNNII